MVVIVRGVPAAEIVVDGPEIADAASARDLVVVHRERGLVARSRALHLVAAVVKDAEIGPERSLERVIALREPDRRFEVGARFKITESMISPH